jgi:redox-sensitive bicupin YhaK (pirin superfamily)
MLIFSTGETISIKNESYDSPMDVVLLITGVLLNEPVVRYGGPFVMNVLHEIEQSLRRL